ncbi:MAG: hypothetical protein GX607_04730 [Myxococcales bacterium]|jgi:hypothetical protein|nr:hypothetical protein [Myxococcales bacterium]
MEEEHTEKLKSTLSDVRSGGEAAKDTAKREGHQLAAEAKERLDSEVSARKGMVAKELGHLGNALEVSAHELEKNDSALTDTVRQVARFCDRSAKTMERKGPRELLAQVETFGREQPLLFFGAAIAASFFATRLLRSDSGQAQAEQELDVAGGESERPAFERQEHEFERQEGEATALAPRPAIPTTETLNLTGPESESERPYGTT